MPSAAPEVAANAAAASRSPSAFDVPYGFPGSGGSLGRCPWPVTFSPAKTSFVEMTRRSVRRAAHAAASTPVATALRRSASSGSQSTAVHVRPCRGVDDDLWPVALEAVADGVGGIKVERRAIPGDRSGGTGEWGVLEKRWMSARPSRPPAPVTATRISRASAWRRPLAASAAASVGRRSRSGARREPLGILTLVPAVPIAGSGGAPPCFVCPEPVHRRREAILERQSAPASRERQASSRPSRNGGRGRADPRPSARATTACRAAREAAPRRPGSSARRCPARCRSRRSTPWRRTKSMAAA